jgi:glycosyltransferase involved in cell wall biosynthesis
MKLFTGKQLMKRVTVCVAVPTYMRDGVLVDTLRQLIAQEPPADEVLVIDQSPTHDLATSSFLSEAESLNRLRWIRHAPPSLPGARNRALLESVSDIIIFIDDDVELSPGFIEAHRDAHLEPSVYLVTGQVLNRNRTVISTPITNWGLDFPRNHSRRSRIASVFGNNHSCRRQIAIDIGGYDENYLLAAYREESDFALRYISKTESLALFEPSASLVHLAEPSGGCRSWGAGLDLFAVGHSIGDYYFALMNLAGAKVLKHGAMRMVRTIANRDSIRRPWRIPFLLIREVAAMLYAIFLGFSGRALISRRK